MIILGAYSVDKSRIFPFNFRDPFFQVIFKYIYVFVYPRCTLLFLNLLGRDIHRFFFKIPPRLFPTLLSYYFRIFSVDKNRMWNILLNSYLPLDSRIIEAKCRPFFDYDITIESLKRIRRRR